MADARRRRLLAVWWSATGGTRQLVEAAIDAARAEPSVECVALRADRAIGADLLASDAAIFAAPENLGSMAGAMKDFFDRSYYEALGRIEGRAYATIVCAGTDGQGAIRQIERIATGWRLRRVAEPLLVLTGAQTPEAILAPKVIAQPDLLRARELGASLAAGLALGIW